MVLGSDVNARNTSEQSDHDEEQERDAEQRLVGEHVGQGDVPHDRGGDGHERERGVDDDVHHARRRVDLAEAPARADRRAGPERDDDEAGEQRVRHRDQRREHRAAGDERADADDDLGRAARPDEDARRVRRGRGPRPR